MLTGPFSVRVGYQRKRSFPGKHKRWGQARKLLRGKRGRHPPEKKEDRDKKEKKREIGNGGGKWGRSRTTTREGGASSSVNTWIAPGIDAGRGGMKEALVSPPHFPHPSLTSHLVVMTTVRANGGGRSLRLLFLPGGDRSDGIKKGIRERRGRSLPD